MFLFPALTIGFLFVGVPLLVHLINMLRHRRQQWAAMDFLLASYRKQKKWIILRQLLLLLARTAVAAVLIAMLCGWISGGRLLGALGGRTVHHVVVLDDSYSMADISSGGQTYQRALASLRSLTERLAASEGQHQLTVLRSSRAELVLRGGGSAGDAAADLSVQTITGDARLIDRVMATEASPMSVDLVPAMRLAGELIGNTPADETVAYVISDFRERDWQAPERIAEILEGMDSENVDLRFIDSATTPASNLGITKLQPLPDVWVSDVPVVVQTAVKNYGATPVTNVNLAARVIRYGSEASSPDPTRQYSGLVEPLPGVVIERLEPGEEVVRQFQVHIAEPGTHAIQVTLPDDALPTDNSRTCTLPLSAAQRVLIVDGDAEQQGAYHIASVLEPGSQVSTGAIPDVRAPTFLRSATLEDLRPYRAIYLVDPKQITQNAAHALSQYVAEGGGLAWILGENAQPQRLNEVLLAEGRNLLPGALATVSELPLSTAAGSDVVMADEHSLTEPFRPLGNAVFGRVGLAESWSLDLADPRVSLASPVREVLNRRDRRPFVLQHSVGRGQVVTVLAGLEGRWSNWPGDPTFVIFMLRANAFLWSGAAVETSRTVDQPIELTLSTDRYGRTAQVLAAVSEPPRVPIEMQAEPTDAGLQLSIDPREAAISGSADVDAMLVPGITEVWLSRIDGQGEVRPMASVITPTEGDLRRADRRKLQQDLQPIRLQFYSTDDVLEQSNGSGGSTTTLILLALLGTLLASEQALAYWASYHPPRGGGPA
ncbi:BatA domain-containing protein [Roseimaritima ulvae]|uniref:Aerotolerance regulator N-terminal domain-containing protein n=1 Tax=Roseimaritima ulvae TaxID=980254 RepID=A0A5B9QWU5_9BACT|nr:BatA domain-containing protein [Roseimaritima ulvae]QEG42270.1 hypothetical protein UC8_43040 [Roseimaritima ulvae]